MDQTTGTTLTTTGWGLVSLAVSAILGGFGWLASRLDRKEKLLESQEERHRLEMRELRRDLEADLDAERRTVSELTRALQVATVKLELAQDQLSREHARSSRSSPRS